MLTPTDARWTVKREVRRAEQSIKGDFVMSFHSMDCLGFAGEFHGIKIVDRRGEELRNCYSISDSVLWVRSLADGCSVSPGRVE